MSQETPSSNFDMDSIMSSMTKRRVEIKERMKLNRDSILNGLQKLGATRVVVTYSGSGDSGCVDSAEVYRVDTRIDPIDTISFLTGFSQFDPSGPGWVEKQELKTVPISEALEQFVYDWLETEHGGWENNDGASGECTIVVPEGSVVLGHTSYYTESDYSEHSL